MKIGFDNEKYLTLQAEQIRKRRAQFGDKLYLEFGGKLFDDYHAARVLPGFQPDSKLRMLSTLRSSWSSPSARPTSKRASCAATSASATATRCCA